MDTGEKGIGTYFVYGVLITVVGVVLALIMWMAFGLNVFVFVFGAVALFGAFISLMAVGDLFNSVGK